MRIIVLHPKCAKESAKALNNVFQAAGFESSTFNPYRNKVFDNFKRNASIFNYGVSDVYVNRGKCFNYPAAVKIAKNKLDTLSVLTRKSVPCINFTTDRSQALTWESVCVRKTLEGRANEGLTFWNQGIDGAQMEHGRLYTEYYQHHTEFRVVVFKGKVIGRYEKLCDDDGTWVFNELSSKLMSKIDKACIDATKAIGLDYSGVDVLVNSPTEFKICEVNSAPTLIEGVGEKIVKLLKEN